MKFDEATSFTIKNDSVSVRWQMDAFILFLYYHKLDYKYKSKSQRRGTLEIYNVYLDEVFDVILHKY